MSPFKAGLIAIVVLARVTFVGFTKANPFAHPYKFSRRSSRTGTT